MKTIIISIIIFTSSVECGIKFKLNNRKLEYDFYSNKFKLTPINRSLVGTWLEQKKELEKRKIPSQMELYYKLYGYPIQK